MKLKTKIWLGILGLLLIMQLVTMGVANKVKIVTPPTQPVVISQPSIPGLPGDIGPTPAPTPLPLGVKTALQILPYIFVVVLVLGAVAGIMGKDL